MKRSIATAPGLASLLTGGMRSGSLDRRAEGHPDPEDQGVVVTLKSESGQWKPARMTSCSRSRRPAASRSMPEGQPRHQHGHARHGADGGPGHGNARQAPGPLSRHHRLPDSGARQVTVDLGWSAGKGSARGSVPVRSEAPCPRAVLLLAIALVAGARPAFAPLAAGTVGVGRVLALDASATTRVACARAEMERLATGSYRRGSGNPMLDLGASRRRRAGQRRPPG